MMSVKVRKKAAGAFSFVNCEVRQSGELSVLWRHSAIVGNGKKSSGAQNYLCKVCGKQFQKHYLYWACDKRVKDQIVPMLLRGSGVRDCAVVLGISANAVLRHLARQAQAVMIKPKQSRYHKVQIDELWSYVGNKDKKVWLLYAYCVESEEIPGFSRGKRSTKTVRI